MGHRRLPYDDAASPAEMASDCGEVGRELHLPLGPDAFPHGPDGFGHLAWGEQHPPAPTPQVSPELAALADDLELHLG